MWRIRPKHAVGLHVKKKATKIKSDKVYVYNIGINQKSSESSSAPVLVYPFDFEHMSETKSEI